MALVTTFATTPLLDVLLGRRGFADATEDDVRMGKSSAKA